MSTNWQHTAEPCTQGFKRESLCLQQAVLSSETSSLSPLAGHASVTETQTSNFQEQGYLYQGMLSSVQPNALMLPLLQRHSPTVKRLFNGQA